MFKRLFLLSGIIAFILASLMMWFWYLPMKATDEKINEIPETVVSVTDTTTTLKKDSIVR